MKIICKYCDTFYHATNRWWDVEEVNNKRIKKHFRECPVIRKGVQENTEACDKFILCKYIWCTKSHNWLRLLTCLARQERKEAGCQRCRQGKLMQRLYKYFKEQAMEQKDKDKK